MKPQGIVNRTVNGAMEHSATERIWELILQIVTVIADLLLADERGNYQDDCL